MSGEKGNGHSAAPPDAETVEGTAQEIVPSVAPAAPVLAVAPQIEATDLVARLDAIKDAQSKAMTRDVDYGVIPGTDKPTLYKPGAEKLSVLFQLDVQLVNEKQWGPDDHLTVISHATVFHAPTGSRLGYGEGVCTTRERKYAYRKAERVCPNCNTPAVIKGKAEYGGGWLCWSKRGGCNSKWADGAEAIESQKTGDVDNPDLPDLWNTVVKMAEKRARVDAVLAVTGASALFTQDVEDAPRPAAEQSAQQPPAAAADAGATITKARATQIVERLLAAGIDSNTLHLQLVAMDVDHEGVDTKAKAVAVVRGLTAERADALEQWVTQCEAKIAERAAS